MLEIITPTTVQWRLAELDGILDEFDSDMAEAVSRAEVKTSISYANAVIYTVGKSLITFREIICLSAFGYPDGALALARNIYEQLIVLSFFELNKNTDEFQTYLDDYFLDYEIQRCKAMNYEYEHCGGNENELNANQDMLKQFKAKAHRNIRGDYWWSGYPTFSKLADNIILKQDDKIKRFLHGLHYTYKRACVSLHSSSLGNAIRLGNESEFVGVDTSPTVRAHDIPLWFATASFIMIVGVACNELNIDFEKYKTRLNDLSRFYRSQGEMESANS